MKIISADERLDEQRGAKILIVGPPGVGKTSLLRTLDTRHTLFVDAEAGDLSVQDVKVDTIRVDTWPQARDLAVRITGPNPSFTPTMCYSQAHYNNVGGGRCRIWIGITPSSSIASPSCRGFHTTGRSSSQRYF